MFDYRGRARHGHRSGASFCRSCYKVAMLARSAERLQALESEIEDAHAFPCGVTDSKILGETVDKVRETLGKPRIVIHNAVGGAMGSFREIDPSILEMNFQVNTMALLHLARLTVDDMIEAGEGVIRCTGNTSAYRGKAAFAGFAPSEAAQRILMESIAREVGPLGIHATFVAIDAVIDVPWAREVFADKPDEFFSKPVDIARVCHDIAHQPRSTWCSEIVIRPVGETW